MKRSVFAVLFLSLLFFNLIHADIGNSFDRLQDDVNDLQDQYGSVEKGLDELYNDPATASANYLRRGWDNLLENNQGFVGDVYRGFKSYVLPWFGPTSLYLLGMEPIFSWEYILMFVFFIVIVTYYFRIYGILRDFSTFSDNTSLVIAVCLTLIMIVLGTFRILSRFLTDSLIGIFSNLNSVKGQIILVVGTIVVLILLGIYSKWLKKLFDKMKENRDKTNREIEAELSLSKMKAGADVADAIIGGVSNEKKGNNIFWIGMAVFVAIALIMVLVRAFS
jgi:hypothetical protein